MSESQVYDRENMSYYPGIFEDGTAAGGWIEDYKAKNVVINGLKEVSTLYLVAVEDEAIEDERFLNLQFIEHLSADDEYSRWSSLVRYSQFTQEDLITFTNVVFEKLAKWGMEDISCMVGGDQINADNLTDADTTHSAISECAAVMMIRFDAKDCVVWWERLPDNSQVISVMQSADISLPGSLADEIICFQETFPVGELVAELEEKRQKIIELSDARLATVRRFEEIV